jgi:hypothetical protein
MKIARVWRASTAIAVFATAPLTVTVADSDPLTASAAAAFVNRTDMRDWLAEGERGLWIQMASLKWFYARLTGRCPGLDSTNSLAVDTRASGDMHRMTSVVVPGRGRCPVQSFAPSTGPAKDRNAKVVLQPQAQ